MFRSLRLMGVYALVGVLALFSSALAAHMHQSAHTQLGNKINTPGKHPLKTVGNHTASAHVVAGGKISHVSVSHPTKTVAVKKYKTTKRIVQANARNEFHYVSAEAEALVTAFVGFAFFDGTHWFIFWFPLDLVQTGDQGCMDFDNNPPPQDGP